MKIQESEDFKRARSFKIYPAKMEYLDENKNFITEFWIKLKIGSSRKKRYVSSSEKLLKFKTFHEAMEETKRLHIKFENDFNLPGTIAEF